MILKDFSDVVVKRAAQYLLRLSQDGAEVAGNEYPISNEENIKDRFCAEMFEKTIENWVEVLVDANNGRFNASNLRDKYSIENYNKLDAGVKQKACYDMVMEGLEL